jgi:hypothetical protein
MYDSHALAPSGSTGNNTHSAVQLGGSYEAIAFQFEVEAAGTTVTWKVQGSLDGESFFDLAYITDASDTVATAGKTVTTVSKQVIFLSNPVARRYRYFRLVTSANTGITYRADAFPIPN